MMMICHTTPHTECGASVKLGQHQSQQKCATKSYTRGYGPCYPRCSSMSSVHSSHSSYSSQSPHLVGVPSSNNEPLSSGVCLPNAAGQVANFSVSNDKLEGPCDHAESSSWYHTSWYHTSWYHSCTPPSTITLHCTPLHTASRTTNIHPMIRNHHTTTYRSCPST